LACSSAVFLVLAFGIFSAVRFYFGHATRPEDAELQVVSGNGALIRSAHEREWRLITGSTEIHEGDEISTALGTVVWLTMFDGSTVEVSEDTVVRIARMRSSRYLDSTKNIILEPERGTIYIGMAAHEEYDYSEFTVRRPEGSITMSDEPGRETAGSFLVEVIPAEGALELQIGNQVRMAVLRGEAHVSTSDQSIRLSANEQAIVAADGRIGPVTAAVRELIQNGDLEQGLSGWVEFEQQSPRTAGVAASGASVELVSESIEGMATTAVEFLRGSEADDIVQIGIRQRVGQTLRVYSSLIVQFDVKITDQRPLGGGTDLLSYPFVVKLIYIDVEGQEREWSRGYYVLDDPVQKVPLDRAARVDLDKWQHIAFDLRGMSPLPKQVTAVVLYASGQSFQTRVANISLSSSELASTKP
jgi:hypothetical protein